MNFGVTLKCGASALGWLLKHLWKLSNIIRCFFYWKWISISRVNAISRRNELKLIYQITTKHLENCTQFTNKLQHWFLAIIALPFYSVVQFIPYFDFKRFLEIFWCNTGAKTARFKSSNCLYQISLKRNPLNLNDPCINYLKWILYHLNNGLWLLYCKTKKRMMVVKAVWFIFMYEHTFYIKGLFPGFEHPKPKTKFHFVLKAKVNLIC